jgi:hypothetical protein
MQAMHISSSSRGSGARYADWVALLGAVRGGKAGTKEVNELAQRVMRAPTAAV